MRMVTRVTLMLALGAGLATVGGLSGGRPPSQTHSESGLLPPFFV
jgi:hypothetical protein